MLIENIESAIINNKEKIELWFDDKWENTKAQITVSVDLRRSNYKIVPVDTNLFPAGFNNLDRYALSLCVDAFRNSLITRLKSSSHILLIAESHTRNQYYIDSLYEIYRVLDAAGFIVHIGMLDDNLEYKILHTSDNYKVKIDTIKRIENDIVVSGIIPSLILLNNDLSNGIPNILQNINQEVLPDTSLGWHSRKKSQHFICYDKIVYDFSKEFNIDAWLINTYFDSVKELDFITQEGIENLVYVTDLILSKIEKKYKEYNIKEVPYIVIKANNGTYGMGVMHIKSSEELLTLNRKKRTSMSVSKGKNVINEVLVQEGVYSNQIMNNNAVAEPVIYLIDKYVVGGFYRMHDKKGISDNLNSPGMYFEPIIESPKSYVYGVIARLAALAASIENNGTISKRVEM